MLLKTFRKSNLILLILTPIILALLWIPAFINPHLLVNISHQMPIYEGMIILTNENPLVLNIIAYFLLVALAFLIVRINERFLFVRIRTDFPALLLVLIASGTTTLNGMHPALLSLIFIFFALENSFAIYNSEKSITKSFNAGVLIGLATITYLFASVYLLGFWIALAVLKQFKIREVLASAVGFFVPLFFAGSIYYLNGSLDNLLIDIKTIIQNKIDYSFSDYQMIYWIILGFFLVISTIFTLKIHEEQSISSRKNISILSVFMLFTVAAFLMTRASGIELYYFISIPITVFLSKYFVLSRYSWLKEAFFITFLLANVMVHIL